MSEHDIHQDDSTMGENPGAEGDFASGQGQEGQSADFATAHPTGTEQPRADEVIEDDMDAAGEDEPIPGVDDSTEGGLLTTPNDYDEGQTLTGQSDDGLENNYDEGQNTEGLLATPNDFDEGQTETGQLTDGVENNFDEGQAGGGVPGNHAGGEGMTP